MVRRRHRHHWPSPFYNKIIRLEGQIRAALEILRFRLRYRFSDSDRARLIIQAQFAYFRVIDELVTRFLEQDLDLANFTANLGGLVRWVTAFYFENPAVVGEESREDAHHWPMILFFQELQMILEDESRSLEQSIMDGWKLYLNPVGYPCRFNAQVREYAQIWSLLDVEEQTETLEHFRFGPEMLANWLEEINKIDLSYAADADTERCAPVETTFTTPSTLLDMSLLQPWSNRILEDCKQDISDWPICPICRGPLNTHETGTVVEHRPVQMECGHIYGNSCITQWLAHHQDCPTCRADFRSVMRQCGLDMVKCLNRPFGRHTLDSARLGWICRPVDEVRIELGGLRFQRGNGKAESTITEFVVAVQDQSRLEAFLEHNEEDFREALQVQVCWLVDRVVADFLNEWHPSFSVNTAHSAYAWGF